MWNKTNLAALTVVIAAAIAATTTLALSPAAAAQSDADSLRLREEVVVTGSRIPRSNLSSPTPVTLVDAEELRISANTNIADTLNQLTASGVPGVAQTTGNFTVFGAGTSTVDLRNLGTTRTLVLVNGRRHVAGSIDNPSVVDLNSIPNAFIDRVEVITGGASAVYGSEALAGVINIITKKDFEGLSVDTQYGISEQRDGQDGNLSITGGAKFADGRGHAMFNAGYQELSAVNSADRPLSATDNFLGNFRAFSSFAPTGSINAPTGEYRMTDDGEFRLDRDGNRIPVLAFFTDRAAGGGAAPWTTQYDSAQDGFNRAAFRRIQLPLTRKNINFDLNYALSDTLNFFVESSYAQTSSTTNLEPSIIGQFLSVGGEDLTMPANNPFIPDAIVQAYADVGIDLKAPDAQPLVWRKRFLEIGPRVANPSRDTQRLALGLQGEWRNGSQWDIYYQFGQTSSTFNNSGDFNTFNFAQGLNVEPDPDNAGEYRCVNELARALGCVPINVFGEGSISEEALDYVRVPTSNTARLQQQVVAGNLSGDLFTVGTGKIEYASGFEYRKEQYERTTDALAAAGLSSTNASAPVDGSYDVWEIYGELNIPLIADMLTADAAYRYGDYSTVDGISQWKLGLRWTPLEDLRIRLTQSQAVRAPNVAELFDPGSETFESFTDPCTDGGTDGPDNTQANCASLGIPNDYDPGINGSSAGGFQSGNPNLEEETSDSTTLGIVYTPRQIEGLSITLDYFDIEIEKAIEEISPQIKLDECYAAADFPNNRFCAGIERNGAALDYTINRLDFGVENIGQLSTSGIDLELKWTFSAQNFGLQHGQFNWTSRATYTNDWERIIFEEVEDNLREPGYNKIKWNNRLNWQNDLWSLSWTWRLIGSGVADNAPTFQGNPLNDIGQQSYHDLSAQYKLEFAGAEYEWFAAVRNALDKAPPYIPEPSSNSNTGTGTAAGVYDPIGRYLTTGLRIKF